MVFNLHPEGGPLNPRKPKDCDLSLDQFPLEFNESIDGNKDQKLLTRIKQLLAEDKVDEAFRLWEEARDNEGREFFINYPISAIKLCKLTFTLLFCILVNSSYGKITL